MLCLPFVLGHPQPPVATFFAEWLAGALGVVAALLALGKTRTALPYPAHWLVGFALFIVAQAWIGTPAYWQVPAFAVLCVLYAALMVWLGRELAALGDSARVLEIFATSLLIGALVNSAIGIMQAYGHPAWLDDWILTMRGGRAMGNIGQINLYANYLVVGQVALLYLWMSRRVSTTWSIVATLILVTASALSGTRSSLFFVAWLVALAFWLRLPGSADARRLRFGSMLSATAVVVAHLAVPWINQAILSHSSSPGAFERLLALGSYAEPRWQAWLISARLFLDSPMLGVGIGQFARAAFSSGLDPDLSGFVWTSPHNLVLQLLAETGLPGTLLVAAAIASWLVGALRMHRLNGDLSAWFAISIVGIELIHSMLEFPLWNVHFLGMTALIAGVVLPRATVPAKASRRPAILAIALAIAAGLGSLMADYLRFDSARVIGTRATLASVQDSSEAASTMQRLSAGLLGPLADGWILLGSPIDADHLPEKLALSSRVIQYWPGSDMLSRHATFLALSGDYEQARQTLALAARAFPNRCEVMASPLRQALAANPSAIAPLLVQLNASTQNCR